jgi:RNA polymerase sigma-70 factor (ECF subfamily)
MIDEAAAAAQERRMPPSGDSDADNRAMRLVREGDLDKLSLLYDRYAKPLYAFFYRLTSNSTASEDLVQNVFVRVLKYRDNFRDEGRFSTWLFAIAHNVKNDYLRKVLRRREELSAGRHDPVDPGDLAADVEKSERAAAVMRAIERLSPVQREALVLFRIEGLKSREIAGILNCSENTVKARIFRALESLKKMCREGKE